MYPKLIALSSLALVLMTAGPASAQTLLEQLRANINDITLRTETEKEDIALCRLVSDNGYENGSDMRELFLKVPVSDEEMKEIAGLQKSDGSFCDIDYGSTLRGSWPVSIHAFRVQRLAIRYASTGDGQALDCALKAIRWWASETPLCPNWWHNEIGIPRLMGPAYLLLMDQMSGEEIQGAVRTMGKARFGKTGQNKVWLAGNVLIKGLLEGDEELVRQARDTIASEIHVSDTAEGLQDDWSFHQHGPQLQFGNYGLSYATSLSFWSKAFEGTDLEFEPEKMSILRNYLSRGLCQVIWKGWFDHNACGRQIFLNSQKGKAMCAIQAAENLGIDIPLEEGGIYYPKSDFGIFRGKSWYASIRMQSLHVKGYETTNNENMKGYFSSDGALLVRSEGDEYDNISPVWNWRHVPGTTTWDDGTDIICKEASKDDDGSFYNLSDKVGGRVDAELMTVWMEYKRDSLKARKMWVFTQDFIVCLGSGITMPGGPGVTTTVDQCLLRSEVSEGRNWVCHAGKTYVMLDGSPYVLNNGPHEGSWRPISPTYSDEKVSEDLFEMYIDHGKAPKNASYAYVIVPDGKNGAEAAALVQEKVKIIRNSPARQVVRIGSRTVEVSW